MSYPKAGFKGPADASDFLSVVKDGYQIGAVPYRRQKDESLIKLFVVNQWLELAIQMR